MKRMSVKKRTTGRESLARKALQETVLRGKAPREEALQPGTARGEALQETFAQGMASGKSVAWGKGRWPAVLAAGIAAVMIMGCGAAGGSPMNSASPSYAAYERGEAGGASYDAGAGITESVNYDSAVMEPEEGPEESGGTDGNISQGRKLIRTVELEMETKEFERMMSELEARIQELGGYMENLETYNGSSYSGHRSSRWASLTIRIPSGALNGFLQNMSEIGNVVRRSDSVEDVTLSYVDMESRRDTLKAEQTRLLELLEKADTVEDMIALEERLSNVRYHLESMESKLRTVDNQVDYSTVYLSLSEVKELTPVEEKTDLQRITEGFAASLKDIGSGIREGAIWFVIHIPYLVIWAAVITVLALILKKCGKKRRARKEAAKAKTAGTKRANGETAEPVAAGTERANGETAEPVAAGKEATGEQTASQGGSSRN